MIAVRPFFAAIVLCSATAFAQQPATSPQQQESHGKVIFSRSVDDAEQQQTPSEKAIPAAVKVSDAERSALVFTSYDLDVHLMLKQQSLAVQARVTVRNDSNASLTKLPLQLSSSLQFESVSEQGKKLPLVQQFINSDGDHTGQLREAVVTLPEPLAPKAEVALNIAYSGEIQPSTKRLEQIGTPVDLAQQSDWDQVSEDFTGLRGFGDVVWYPVSSVPQALGDGAKLFEEIGRQKLHQQNARVTMRITAEYSGAVPNAAAIDGRFVQVPAPSVTPSASFPGIVTFSLPEHRLGFGILSLFLAPRIAHEANGVRVLALDSDEPNAQGYLTAVTMVQPLVEQWLGNKTKEPLTIFDLPETHDASFEQGTVAVTGLQPVAPQQLTDAISHSLAHAYFQSSREWLNEGVANFLGTLWIEQTQGREAALEHLEASRGALAVGEPSSPGEDGGQPLIEASDAVYYRSKATYVLWMLRDLAGDKALSAALRAYDPAKDTAPDYFESLVEQASGKDLKWFFDDWVYHDRGLPDLSIAGTFPSAGAQSGQTLLAIDIQNDGYATAEVPVTVRTAGATQTARVRVAARTKTSHRMLVQGEPTEVVVNDGVVPEVQATIHRRDIIMTSGAK